MSKIYEILKEKVCDNKTRNNVFYTDYIYDYKKEYTYYDLFKRVKFYIKYLGKNYSFYGRNLCFQIINNSFEDIALFIAIQEVGLIPLLIKQEKLFDLYYDNHEEIDKIENNGESLEAFCNGTGQADGMTFQQWIDNNWFINEYLEYFERYNIIVEDIFRNYPVLAISHSQVFDNTAISNLVLNKDLKIITDGSFQSALLTTDVSSITIPNSVRYIGNMALPFRFNDDQIHPLELNILGKPYIDNYPIGLNFTTIRYGGTCQELHNNSSNYNNKSYIIYGPYDHEYDVITTDTNTCKVYATTD